MRWLSDILFRVRAILDRSAMERDLDDEFAFHVEKEAEKLVAQGMEPAEALRRARLRFGGQERFKETARESWGVSGLTDLAGDLRFARRQLLEHPGFTVLAVLTLALGIGGTVALFSVVNGLLLRPLPYPDEDRLVSFWSDYNWRGEEFDLVKEIPESFESIAAYSNAGYTLRTEAGSSIVLALVSSVELWDVLDVRPLLGRTFLPGEDRPGAEKVVVLSHGIWQRELGGDREIVGRRVDLDGVPHTVVGVMPEDFYFPDPEWEVFVPLDLDPGRSDYAQNGWLVLIGKLKQDANQAGVDRDLASIATALDERYDYPTAWDKTRNPRLVPQREYVLGDIRPAMLLLLSTVGLLLLMACANVTALILTRTVDRTREMSVRTALGAGRARLVRQILTESIVLGLVAGMLGVALATGLFDVLVASLPIRAAFRSTLHLDHVTLLSALVLSVTAGSLISLAPIRNLLRGELAEGALTQRSARGQAHAGRMQNVLVATEVLLAVVLVTGAALLVRTVDRLRTLDTGMDPEGVVTLDVMMSESESTEAERVIFYETLLERTRALPGVTAAGYINRAPLRDGGYQGTVAITGRPDLEGVNRPNVVYRPVTPGTFEALGMEIVHGRGIEPTDVAESPLVAVVNETFARSIWGDEDPVGRTYAPGFLGPVEVVGVVSDIAVMDLVGAQPFVGFYAWDQAERGSGAAILVARTEGDPNGVAAPIRAVVSELEPRAAVGRIQTLEDIIDVEMAEPLRLRFFLGLFSALGLVLGTVGVYGVVSYSIQRRHVEFGIRLALGAAPWALLGAVVRRGMVPVALGVAGGAAVALIASRLLARFLYEVEPTDPVSLGAAAATLLSAGAVAALLPAWRASTTDPAEALRSD
jgi:putative ABC transport system permease protein